MASLTGSVWAIDIGSDSLKAMRLTDVNGVVEVIDFDCIKHGKNLTGKGVQPLERDELIALSLRQFMQQHDFDKDDVVISLPSQNSFARFVNLPPVEEKKIPEIIRFEAVQQIPFDINEVQWDWQLMEEQGSDEKKVGIFAIKNDVIDYMLEHFSRENIQINFVQMAPMALYNYAVYDRSDLAETTGNQSIAVLNIGAEYSDLVVCTKSSVWQRCIPIGGNTFTKAISDAFKINFEKAEKLKKNATTSKYARQILQAMKPVFAELASEVQRSIGFYGSSNPNAEVKKIVAIGGGTRMRGLVKYLQQSTQMPIERPDVFEKLAIGPDVPAAKFHDLVCEFGVVYGLGLQALGLGKIESNLLPRSIARSMMWASKAKYFITAAAILLIVSVLSFGRILFESANYSGKQGVRREVKTIIDSARNAQRQLDEQERRAENSKALIDKQFEVFQYRDAIPDLMKRILSSLPNEKNNSDQQQLYEAFKAGDVETVLQTERGERKQIFITNMSIRFSDSLSLTGFKGQARRKRRTRTGTITAAATTGDQSGYEEAVKKMEEMARTRGGQTTATTPSREKQRAAAEAAVQQRQTGEEKIETGFLVTVTGYTPYADYERLLDPPGVSDNPKDWGFVTRLKNIAEVDPNTGEVLIDPDTGEVIADSNCPFKIYDMTNIRHIELIRDVISFDTDIPVGIGVLKQRVINTEEDSPNERLTRDIFSTNTSSGQVEDILIDPMTKEIMSRVRRLNDDGTPVTDKGNPVYEDNDHWFELKLKFSWKEAPEEFKSNKSKKR